MEGDLRRLRGDRDKKRSSLYRSCLHERVILPDYRITSKLHQNYITFTSLLHHFTSDLTSELFVHPPLFPGLLHVLKMVFPVVPVTPHGHAINCASVHRYRVVRGGFQGVHRILAAKIPAVCPCIAMQSRQNHQGRFSRYGHRKVCVSGRRPQKRTEGLCGGARNGCYVQFG